MNLRQLIYLREIATNGFSVSRAAKRLHTSQPGISQQILALERELGLVIFVREKNRLSGLTDAGKHILDRASSALLEIDYIRDYAKSSSLGKTEPFVIATTHTQARYVLPEVLSNFSKQYPSVKLILQHGNPSQIVQALTSGTATIGVTPYTDSNARDIAFLECRTNRRIVLAPKKHPLTHRKQCSIEELAKYPLVAFESSISAWQSVLEVFDAAGVKPNIILSAIDADVVKDCVERGLGLTALTEVAYNPKRDRGLAILKTINLFPPSITSVAIHRKRHLPHYVFDFIEMFAPRWSRAKVEKQLNTKH
jgi:LysR family cys regulon transcriptional activator